MENADGTDMLQTLTVEDIYIQYRSTLDPILDILEAEEQLENISQHASLVSTPSVETLTFSTDDITTTNIGDHENRQSVPQCSDSEVPCFTSFVLEGAPNIYDFYLKNQNPERADGVVERCLCNAKRSGSSKNGKSPLKEPELYICDNCKRSYMSKYTLTRHMKIHSGENGLTCKQYSKLCSKSKQYIRTHTGEKAEHLNSGKMMTGEKPFLCIVCNRSFAWSVSLVQHLRIHTGEKPYPCKVCNKTFRTSGNLKVHTRRHTGEKPFTCSQCGKKFTASCNLSQHMKTHTVTTNRLAEKCI